MRYTSSLRFDSLSNEMRDKLDPERLRQLVEHLPFYAVMIDRQRRLRWANQIHPSLDPASVYGHPIDPLVHEDDREAVFAEIERCFATGEPGAYDTRGYQDGVLTAHYHVKVAPLPAECDEDRRVVLYSANTTEQRRAEDALRRSEARLRLLTTSTPDFIGVIDRERRFHNINKGGELLSEEQVLQSTVDHLTDPADWPSMLAAIERAFDERIMTSYEGSMPGRPERYAVRLLPLPSEDDQERLLMVATDITERIEAERRRAELEAQLQQSQKMELVGQLAGGLAHDFNNLLLVIQAQAEFVESAIDADDGDPKEELAHLRAAANRAGELIQQLLAFGRRQPLETRPIRLSELVAGAMPLMRRAVPASIALVHVVDDDGFVHVDVAQLQQVLLNLCVNARDAIPGATGQIALRQGRGEGGRLVLAVADTGHGIDDEDRERIFEPFFTTKPVGAGTGLGLPMVLGTVERHGGELRVESEKGAGTTFYITLPEERPPERTTSRPLAQPSAGKAKGTIVVAEDEPDVRRIVCRILRNAGYDVVEAKNGAEALEVIEAGERDIDLALLDVVMPEMNGRDAFLRIRTIRPSLPVLFSSGYAEDALPLELIRSEGINLLPKPYNHRTLLTAVHAALHNAAGHAMPVTKLP